MEETTKLTNEATTTEAAATTQVTTEAVEETTKATTAGPGLTTKVATELTTEQLTTVVPQKPVLTSGKLNRLHKVIFQIIYLFFKFWITSVLSVGLLIPLFWTSGDVYHRFQSQGACFVTCVQQILRLTSAATPTDLLLTRMAAELSHLFTCKQAMVGLETESIMCAADSQCETRQTFYQLSYYLKLEISF